MMRKSYRYLISSEQEKQLSLSSEHDEELSLSSEHDDKKLSLSNI